MLIGGHVSTQGGLLTAFERAQEIGAEAVQIHATPPQTWRRNHPDEATVAEFRRRMEETGLDAFFLHAVYLINLAAARPEVLEQSQGALRYQLELANRLGARGVIFHAGSHKGFGFDHVLAQVSLAMRAALAEAPGPSWLIIENSAGAGDNIGSTFTQLARMIEASGGDPRLRVCLDTAHAFTAGYDLRSAEGLDRSLRELEAELGGERLAAVHANDSKAAFASNVDRHANIGEGEIGAEAFRRILHDPRLRPVPFLLEVPGRDRKGPDRESVSQLRELAGLAPLPAAG